MIDISAALQNHVTYIAGNRKNAGKTTFLNCALEQLRPKGHLAYLSIGVDGEERDLVFGHAKPQILAQPGDTLVTAQAALAKTDALYEIRQVFPYKTVLGRLVVAMIGRGGFVELVPESEAGDSPHDFAAPGRIEIVLDRDRRVVVHCHRGGRSAKASRILQGAGFADVAALSGGIEAWSLTVDPEVPRY